MSAIFESSAMSRKDAGDFINLRTVPYAQSPSIYSDILYTNSLDELGAKLGRVFKLTEGQTPLRLSWKFNENVDHSDLDIDFLVGQTSVDSQIGDVWLEHDDPAVLEKLRADEELLAALAAKARHLMYKEWRTQRLKRLARAEKLQAALYAITELASSGKDAKDVFAGIQNILGEFMNTENFIIVRYFNEDATLRFAYYSDTEDGDSAHVDPDEILNADDMAHSVTVSMIRSEKIAHGPATEVRKMLGMPQDKQLGVDSYDWLGVPLFHEGELFGGVVVQSYSSEQIYTKEDEEILAFVATHIATALARHEAAEQLEKHVVQRTHELRDEIAVRVRSEKLQSALYRISQLASGKETLKKFFADIHSIVTELIEASNFYIALVSDDGEQLDFPYSVDEAGGTRQPRPRGHSVTDFVIESKNPLLLDQDSLHPHLERDEFEVVGAQFQSWMGVPLIINDSAVGIIAVQSYSEEVKYSLRDLDLLNFVASHISNALERRRSDLALLKAYDELEFRVEERTKELAETNALLRMQIDVREQVEERLKHDNLHDGLTGLPNRQFLTERLNQAISAFRRDNRHLFAVLFLDLDRFKVVNDSVGHLVGDELLKEAAHRISCCVRGPDTVARLGGDEFCVLLDGIHQAEDSIAVADRIIDAFNDPIRIAGKDLYTSASIGIAICADRYRSPEELLRDADVAMYRAKAAGRKRYAIFDENLHHAALQRLELESAMRKGLLHGEFIPFYQPLVSLNTGLTVGYEALIRWKQADGSVKAPFAFLPLAEETGLLEKLDWQMYESVVADLDTLCPKAGYVSVNLSPNYLLDPSFVGNFLGLLQKNNIDTSRITVEVTEGALIERPDVVRPCLEALRDEGISIWLDDFGTGYSSLSYLHMFPLTGLKIDRSFVMKLKPDDHSSQAMIKAICAMAATLNLAIVAEGVETEEQAQLLHKLGIDRAQGYLFRKPSPLSDYAK